jgi:hypothetical protein
MVINISKDASEIGLKAAQFAAIKLNEAIRTNIVPATLLKQHQDFHLYLDINSASEIIPL